MAARAVVVATGRHTEFGQITGLLQAVQEQRTPLQRNLDKVGEVLAVAAGIVVGLIAGTGVLRGEPLPEMFLFGVALAVAVMPAALDAHGLDKALLERLLVLALAFSVVPVLELTKWLVRSRMQPGRQWPPAPNRF